MGRRSKAQKRQVLGDPIYHDVTLAQFTNKLMYQGKKSVAQRILYDAFDIIKEKVNKDPKEVFHQALNNAKPEIEVRSRRVGGATYQVPVEVRPERSNALGMRWIIGNARSRTGHSMSEKIAAELLDAYKNTGTSIKKKEDTHRMAEANKAFAHFKW